MTRRLVDAQMGQLLYTICLYYARDGALAGAHVHEPCPDVAKSGRSTKSSSSTSVAASTGVTWLTVWKAPRERSRREGIQPGRRHASTGRDSWEAMRMSMVLVRLAALYSSSPAARRATAQPPRRRPPPCPRASGSLMTRRLR